MRYGVAVIGLGNISDSHITGWKRLESVNLKVVVDIDRTRAKTKAKEYGVVDYETDFRKTLRRADIDIVDICVPHHLHAPYSCEALDAGKHVLVKKPIAITLSEAQGMTEAAEKKERSSWSQKTFASFQSMIMERQSLSAEK